ncbi:MAG: hypothetical protein J2P52_18150, partial [Blastocatellia bacterium]|nr:hypothetical protein [Blastocatellia bacterium]
MGARAGAKEILMSQPNSPVPSRLLKAILAKSLIEIILVCVVATLGAFSTFNPPLIGAVERADQTRVAGWIVAPESPEMVIEVQLFIDEKLVASKPADEKLMDLVHYGVTSNPNHGFNFDLTRTKLAPGRHTAQVYALRHVSGANKTLTPIAKQPRVFEV